MKKIIVHPMRLGEAGCKIQTVLRDLAGRENCDGDPYDQMQDAGDYIDELEAANNEMFTVLLRVHTLVQISTASNKKEVLADVERMLDNG